MKKLLLSSLVMAMTANFTFAATGENWMTDFEAAKKKAAEEKKDLFVDFTGSDWCGWCIKLDKEVFAHEPFNEGVADKFILVSLDYPQDKSKMSEELQAQNDELQKKFDIKGFPTILLMDAEGRPYAQTGYQQGGPEKYVEHLDELRENRTKRDEAFASADKLEGVEKAKALVAALGTVPENYLSHYEGTLKEIEALDPKDESGFIATQKRKEALSALQEKSMMAARGGSDGDEVLSDVDAFIKDHALEGQDKQEVLILKINPLMASQKFDETLALLDEVIAAAPESEISARVKEFKPRIEEMKEAAAGADADGEEEEAAE